MIICTAGLFPDIQYFLDAAVEHGELDGLSHAALNLLGDRARITAIVDDDRPRAHDGNCSPELPAPYTTGRVLSRRMDICYSLSAYARSIVSDLDRPHQRAFVAQSLIAERLRSQDLAEILSSWNFHDSTVGGGLEHFRRGADLRVKRDGTPTRRILRRLTSPAAIRRYVYSDSVYAVRHHARLASGICELPWPEHPGEAQLVVALITEQEKLRDDRRKKAMDDFVAKIQRTKRPDIKKRRKALARSAATSERLLGRDPTRAFLRGEAVALPTQNDLVFEVKTENSGHGIRVSLAATRGERLANLCLYFEKTPPLDQLVAMALHIEAGNTEELLATGNLFNVTEAGANHPALRGRYKAATAAVDQPPWLRRRDHLGYDRGRHDRLAKAYTEQFSPLYRYAIESAVWGGRAGWLRRFWAMMK